MDSDEAAAARAAALDESLELGPSSSSVSSASSEDDSAPRPVRATAPARPRLPSRKSSGTLIVPRDSSAVRPPDCEPRSSRSMSPRRSGEDIEALGREAREELKQHAQALRQSLCHILNRLEAVKEEHDKLDNNNKFLQKYIGDLMTTSKITTTSSSSWAKK